MNDNALARSSTDSLIPNMSVRLSVANQPIGSGFMVQSPDQRWAYILTARHCFDQLPTPEVVRVEWYDYQRRVFIPLTVPLTECSLLMLDRELPENSFDGAILVVPVNKLPVSVGPINMVSSIEPDQHCRFVGFPDALSGEEPAQLRACWGIEKNW